MAYDSYYILFFFGNEKFVFQINEFAVETGYECLDGDTLKPMNKNTHGY